MTEVFVEQPLASPGSDNYKIGIKFLSGTNLLTKSYSESRHTAKQLLEIKYIAAGLGW